MLSGIKEILIITSQKDLEQFKSLLHDGSQWGIKGIYCKFSQKARGLAQALILLTEDFLIGCPSILILGDNIFFGNKLSELLIKPLIVISYNGYHVANPERYGVINFKDEKTNIY